MQTPPAFRKHPGGDRTGDHVPRAKITAELAKVINDGLFYYEQDLVEQDVKVAGHSALTTLPYSSGSGKHYSPYSLVLELGTRDAFLNTLRPRPNGRNFAGKVVKHIILGPINYKT